jgi:hypothetical protein
VAVGTPLGRLECGVEGSGLPEGDVEAADGDESESDLETAGVACSTTARPMFFPRISFLLSIQSY